MTRVFALIVLLLAAAPGVARGEELAEQVARAAAAVKAGAKVVVDDARYPESDAQLFLFEVGKRGLFLRYVLDLRAHLCFVQSLASQPLPITPVACSAVKKGYPLVAPLITWDD